MAAQIADLPCCLMIEILSRLPISSLLMCKSVCKSWRLLFSDPFFVELQLAKSPNCILRLGRYSDGPQINLVSFAEKKKMVETAVIDSPTQLYRCFNSCNGLLCFELGGRVPSRQIWVGNPILREWITIQSLPHQDDRYLPGIALGFSPKSNQYKLLSIEYLGDGVSSVLIYTLGGAGQWRIVDPMCPLIGWNSLNTLTNGSVHWVSKKNSFPVSINYFDFESEMFGTLPLPPHSYDRRDTVELSVLNGRLSVSVDDCTKYVKIWSMMEYGVEKSWTMMHSIAYRAPPFCREDVMIAVLSLSKDEILLMGGPRGSGILASFNTKTGRCWIPDKAAQPQHGYSWFSFTVYTPSFVSLYDVAVEERRVVQFIPHWDLLSYLLLTAANCKQTRNKPVIC